MKFDIVISVMNKPSINNVIEHLLGFKSLLSKIIIVDFDKCKPSFNQLVNQNNNFTKVIYLKNHKTFNKSIGLNIGFYYSKSDFVTFCDGDVLLDIEYFNIIKSDIKRSSKRKFYNPKFVKETENSIIRNAPGICTCNRNDFLKINGFSNKFIGWGMEDNDFISRLKKSGAEQMLVSFGLHLTHSDKERVKNYENQDIEDTRKINKSLFNIRNNKNILNGSYEFDTNTFINEH